MDKSGDMRRGASRFSRHKIKQFGIGPSLLSHSDLEFESLDKSKKEKKLKSLSLVGGDPSFKEEGEMSCDFDFSISDGEKNIIPSKSHSTNKKLKHPKRSLDECNGVDHSSVPRKLRSAMKKRNRESLSPPLSDSKKPNNGVESLERTRCGSITKDEEEVAETLNALAKMFTENSKLEAEVKVAKENLNSVCVKADPDLPDTKIHNMETDIHQMKLTAHVSSLPKSTVDCDFKLQREASVDAAHSKQQTLCGATTIDTRVAKESKKNGLVLWPGLCSTLPKIEGNQCSSRSSTSVIPNHVEAATSDRKLCSLEKSPWTTKVSNVSSGRCSMKRCAAHVYITHLIRGLKTPNCKDKSTPPSSNEPRLVSDLDRVKDGLNCVLSLQQQKNNQNQQQQIGLSPGLKKQESFDFLTLSSGGGRIEGHERFVKAGNRRMESMSQVSFPYLQTLPQHSQAMPFPRHQTQQVHMQLPPYLRNSYSATTSLDLTKQQQQQQLWAAQLSGQYRSSRYPQQQQEQFPSSITTPSLKSRRQSIYEESSGGCRPGSALPLQLLCHGRL